MARITVEDCLEKVDSLFDLVLVSAKRAHRISNGAEPMVDRRDDKPTVIALREIAEGLVTRDILDEVDDVELGEIMTEENIFDATPQLMPGLPRSTPMVAPMSPSSESNK